MSKRILIVHRYFYPDTPPYAVMLKKIAEALLRSGYQVDVLTSMPSYYGSKKTGVPQVEHLNGLNVYRIKLLPEQNRNLLFRAINSVLFAILVFFKILFRSKYDLMTIASTPPIIMSTIMRIVTLFKRVPYVYHLQDIYPEIAYGNGNIKSKFLYRLLQSVDRRNNNHALKNIVLSSDMASTLIEGRKIKSDKVAIINNFIRTDRNNTIDFSYANYGDISPEDFKVVFCGNIGKLQNLDDTIVAAKQLQEYPDIKFIFIGEGIERKKLEQESGNLLNKKIFFLGYFESSKALAALEKSDIGLVSISEPTYKTAYPCKTMTYLNAGIPVLAIMNKQAELSKFLTDNKLGLIANPNDISSITETILTAYNKKATTKDNQMRIQEKANKEFGEQEILKKWVQLFDGLTK